MKDDISGNAENLVGTVSLKSDGAAETDSAASVSVDDFDGDGMIDQVALDADGDGLADVITSITDGDGDGVADTFATDFDGDGVADMVTTMMDTDGDGLTDTIATDLDGDGVADMVTTMTDTDGDGIADTIATDMDGDGVADMTTTMADTDGDGMIDTMTTDYDGDGVADEMTTFSDHDGDGFVDTIATDSDMDGVADSSMVFEDVDGDGVSDQVSFYEDTGGGDFVADTDGADFDDLDEVEGGGLMDDLLEACFTGDMRVHTPNGQLPISTVDVGQEVESFCSRSNRMLRVRVRQVKQASRKRIWRLELDNGVEVRTTRSHRLLSTNGWTTVRRLKAGDQLYTAQGIASLRVVEKTKEWAPVYNLIVEGPNTYVVEGLIAHSFTYFPRARGTLLAMSQTQRNWVPVS